jgi:hypothetical protein
MSKLGALTVYSFLCVPQSTSSYMNKPFQGIGMKNRTCPVNLFDSVLNNFRASLKKAEEDDFDSFLDFDGDTASKVGFFFSVEDRHSPEFDYLF